MIFNRSSLIRLVVAGALLLAAVIVAMALHIQGALEQNVAIEEPLYFEVKPGESASGIYQRLKHSGVVTDTFSLRIAGRINKELSMLKAGTYLIKPSHTVNDVLSGFFHGKEAQFTVTLVEGLTLKQWLLELSRSVYLEPLTENQQQALFALAEAYGAGHPEGLFLPDTYAYTANSDAYDVLQRAHNRLQTFLNEQWDLRDPTVPLDSPYAALILASIIEKETGVAEERPRIAGVFTNRINANMRLQTDPTVIYGMGERFDGNIRKRDLREATPYNTYVIKGLPPTPIAMASEAAIRAALNPEDTEELFFVAKGDGSHQFSVTLEEHNLAVRKYQLSKKTKK